jgi:hypothetical protein
LKKDIRIGEKYGPAMEIKTQAEADAYFEVCVEHTMSWGRSREEAERIEHANLGYYAGYYDHDTRERVEELFQCAHPIFGKAKDGVPTAEEAYRKGFELGEKLKAP